MREHRTILISILCIVTMLGVGLTTVPIAHSQGQVNVSLGEADLNAFPEISVPVTVANANRVPILGLQAENFEGLEDGAPITTQSVTTHGNPNLTLAVALVLDLSGSAPLEAIRSAAHQFLDSLGPNDRVALIGFNTPLDFNAFDPTREIDFTSDLDAVGEVIDGMTTGGGTAFYEAVYKGVLITAEETADRRAVIVLTDGYDTVSRPEIATADTPRTAARERGVPVFTVGLYNPGYLSDPDYLSVLARETGGRYQEASDPSQLAILFESVVAQLRSEYILTLRTNRVWDGRSHLLGVRVIAAEGVGEAERTVPYPALPPQPIIYGLQRDLNGTLQDVTEGSELRGRVLLVPRISAQNAIARVDYTVDGSLESMTMVDQAQGRERYQPWEWTWDTRRVEEGSHTLEIIAYDNVGNQSDPLSITVQVVPLPNVLGVDLWVIFVIIAANVALAVVLFFVLRRRTERCRTCGRVLDPRWHGVCRHCAAEPTPVEVMEPVAPGEPAAEAVTEETLGAPVPVKTEKILLEQPVIGWLIVEKGPLPGREFRLRDGTTIGRGAENDIIIDDAAVSRQHAKVQLEDGTFFLHDLGAANPTRVNGVEIERHPLTDGDRVELGNTTLVFKRI